MKSLRYSFTVLLLLLSLIPILAQDYSSKIDELVQIYNEYKQFSGTVLVANEKGVIFEGAYGYANLEWEIPNSIDTRFRLGSITKQFTSMLILQLVDEGKIELEKTISDYLPYYRKDIGEKVTIHQLLNHTSGIPSYTSDPEFFPNVSKKYYKPKDFIIEHCSDDLDFEPGSEWSYNNSGYFILGAIIEEVTGETYQLCLKNRIFDTLEMNESGYDNHEQIIPKRATGYTKLLNQFKNSAWIDMSLPYAAGSIYSTIQDMYKWDRALYTEELLSNKLLTKMMTPTQHNYGYGLTIETKTLRNGDSIKVVQHGGGINGFNTMIFRMVDTKHLIVTLNNTPSANLNQMCTEILHIINNQAYQAPKQSIADFLAEYIKEEGIENIEKVYDELKESAQEKYSFSERALNSLGYMFLNNNQIKESIKIFELNIKEYPNSANVYDSMGEAFAKDNQKENAIKNYQKSLKLNSHNENAKNMLAELGVEIKTDIEIIVPIEKLQTYVGEYELMPNFILYITLEDNQLMSRATGQSKFPVFPETEKKFFLKVVEAAIEFNLDDEKNVKSLTLFQSGQVLEAKKNK